MVRETEEPKNALGRSEGAAWVIPCWLCGEPVEVKFSKKNRPYLICDNCGIQVFIRYGKAEDLLIAKIREYQGQKGT